MNWYRRYCKRFFSGALRCLPGLTLVLLVASGASTAAARRQGAAPALVFDGVSVIDVEHGTLLPAQRVVITGNRIRTMGAAGAVKVPEGARVVDARGKYLMPGLWDMHVHTTAYLPYLLLIANGVTGVRDAWAYVPLDTMIRWRREILAGTRVGPPRQILTGQGINFAQSCRREPNGWTGPTCVSTDSADARSLVDSLKGAGVDMIKIRSVPREMYFVLAAEARRVRIPFGGHAEEVTAIEASDSGASIVDHPQYLLGERGIRALCWTTTASIDRCQAVADRFRHNGTWWVPTLFMQRGEGVRAHEVFKRAVARGRAFWAGAPLSGNWLRDSADSGASADSSGIMRMIQRVGLPMLAGTDMDVGPEHMWAGPPGFVLHAELAMYSAEGLTPAEALRTATLNPAKLLHATDSLGTVAPGKLADLVLLDANPLVDITNTTTIRAVVANGRYFDRDALDQLLTEVRTKARQGFDYWWDGGKKHTGMTVGRDP